ncbi:unnamed protein product, partial [Amaranthus hypochondriacus]
MEDNSIDDMDSLFEGMVLFTPHAVENNGANSQSDVFPSINSGSTVNLSLDSSQPLDENLFSDLTVIDPSHVVATETESLMPSNDTSVMTSSTMISETRTAPVTNVFRQSSRKKKRTGLRIGYGRDSHLADDPEPLLHSNEPQVIDKQYGSENMLQSVTTNLNAKGNENLESIPFSSDPGIKDKVKSGQIQHENGSIHVGSHVVVESPSYQVNRDNISPEEGNITCTTPETEALPILKEPEKEEQKVGCDSVEGKYEQVKAQISQKLRDTRERVISISAARKDSRRRRRKALENLELASVKFKEIEQKLEVACEAEDFEMADSLSESLVAAEKEKECMLNALKDAESDCDAIDSKMEEALEHQIAIEEECVSLLRSFSENAAREADVILENVEVSSSKKMDEWYMSIDAVQTKKLEIEIESQLVKEARSTLTDSVELLVENDVKEKDVLCKEKQILTQELEELLRLVQKKEAEIAENNSKIEAADKRIAEVTAHYKDVQTEIDSKFEKLQGCLSQVDLECQDLF